MPSMTPSANGSAPPDSEVPAPRGTIYDRDGRILVDNVPGYAITLLPMPLDSARAVLHRLAEHVELSDERIDRTLQTLSRYGREVVVDPDADFQAVSVIEDHGHPDRFLSDVVTGDRFRDKKGIPGYINKMPAPTKLALEMALHEEQERLALEGELWRLERAWEEAEEIAAISDSLLLPSGADDFFEEHRPTPTED